MAPPLRLETAAQPALCMLLQYNTHWLHRHQWCHVRTVRVHAVSTYPKVLSRLCAMADTALLA